MHPTEDPQQKPLSFHGLGIADPLMESLQKNRFTTPTPIQHQAIPAAIEGKDVIGIAQTGTGKTLAFGVPMMQRLMKFKGRGLVVLPTRELAIQVEETFQKIGRSFGLRTAVLIGGEPIRKQHMQLNRKPHILVVTPGRLIDHLENHSVKLDDVKILVLDEADRMFDMGFAPQLNQILRSLPVERQTMLFSATMPASILAIAARHMKMPYRVEVAPQGTTVELVEQEVIVVSKMSKMLALENILKENKGTVLVFSRTKHGAKRLCETLRKSGYTAAEIHSNRSLGQRKEALEGFKKGKYRVLVATDIAARGIDVTGIGVVVNYDLPENAEDYVHRIGRTGRAGLLGKAISFATPEQQSEVRQIERLIRKNLNLHPDSLHFLPHGSAAAGKSQPRRHFKGGGGGRRRSRPSSHW